MSTIVFYCQMHQPLRLRRYSAFDTDDRYWDDRLNASLLDRVTRKSYVPMLTRLLELIERHEGRFAVNLSVTGMLLEQLRTHQPRVIPLLERLGQRPEAEFLNETYFHSLASEFSDEEFRYQVDRHAGASEALCGHKPVVFRNTELLYNNDLARRIADMGRFRGVLVEGVERVLRGRGPHRLYHPPDTDGLAILPRDFDVSDDIAFRFGDRTWPEWPLTPEKFADKVTRVDDGSRLCHIFIDMESFGEHQWPETGIFEFLDAMPKAVFDASAENSFATVSAVIDRFAAEGVFDAPQTISWADTERDASAWMGNAMQSGAVKEYFRLETPIKQSRDPKLLEDWRRLGVSDHCYYMCTKFFADMAVHNYFNPYASPYDSYINFMNVLDDMRRRVEAADVAVAGPHPRRIG